MTKRNKIIYWIATIWLSLGMLSSGIVQLLNVQEDVDLIVTQLGYPIYFLTILGVWKILGTVAVDPKFPLVKEWAYAGFFFAMSGAFFSHIASDSPMSDIFPTLLLLTLTVVSWYFRPAERKITSVINT